MHSIDLFSNSSIVSFPSPNPLLNPSSEFFYFKYCIDSFYEPPVLSGNSPFSWVFLHLFFWFPEQIDNDYFKVCTGQFQFLDQLRFFFLLLFLWPHRQHMEVPRLEVQSELQPPATATAIAIATPDPSCIRDLYPVLWQHQTLNPQSKARDRTHILMDTKLGS